MKKRRVSLFLILLVAVQFCAYAQNWQSAGTKKFNAEVDQLFSDTATGELYCTGLYWYNDTMPVYGISKWNGSEWDSAFATVGGFAQKRLTKFQGQFYLCKYHYVFRWNGNAWDTVGHADGPLYNFYNDGDSVLYALGGFNSMDAMTTYGIAKYNGLTWSIVRTTSWTSGGGVGTAYRYQGNMYFGGEFFDQTANIWRITKWDGTNWFPVGQGVTGSLGAVFCLEEYNGELYAGGYMESNLGNPGDYIARWNGTNWTQVGGGVNFQVHNMEVFNGDLWVVGQFDQAGGISASYVARYDGVDWCSVGVFDNGMVAIAENNGELYIGGGVWTVDGDSVNKVVKWIGGNNSVACGHLNTGVEDPKNENLAAQVFPNPATTNVTFQINSNHQMFDFVIYDQLGREVWRKQSDEDKVELSTEGFEPGMYFYRIEGNGEVKASGKLIIE